MKNLPCLTDKDDKNSKKFLFKDFGDAADYAMLFVSESDCFVKIDRRIKGNEKQAEEKFKELYGYGSTFSYEQIK
jgi:hypothetical protein